MTKAGMPRKTLRLSARAARLEIRVRKVPNRSRGEVYGHSWLRHPDVHLNGRVGERNEKETGL